MRHLNYKHLLYFWTVASEGGVARAAEVLHVTPQTISGQLKLLDESVGERLFDRSGRNLVLSSTGRLVYEYADDIFSLGAELAQVVRGQHLGKPRLFNVGIVQAIPKLVALRILSPVLEDPDPPRLNCEEGSLERLLGELAVHRLDLVLSDQPLPEGWHVRAYNHPLGHSGIAFFTRRRDARRYRGSFPASLDGAPVLLPAQDVVLRRRLDDWFQSIGVTPRLLAEFEDSALLKAFGQAGAGVFPGPAAIQQQICDMYGAAVVGQTDEVVERFYAISPERRIRHPAVASIIDTARRKLFSEGA